MIMINMINMMLMMMMLMTMTTTTTIIMITAYTAAFPQSGSSSAGISVTGRFPYFFQEVLWVL